MCSLEEFLDQKTDPITPPILLLFFLLDRATVFKKSLKLRRFKSDRDEGWHDCSSIKYGSIARSWFSIWRHIFKIAALRMYDRSGTVEELPAGAGYFTQKSAAIWWVHMQRLPGAMAILWTVPDPSYIRDCYWVMHKKWNAFFNPTFPSLHNLCPSLSPCQ